MFALQGPFAFHLLLAAFGLAAAAAVLWGVRKWLPPTSRARLQLETLGVFRGGDLVLAILFVVGGLALTLYYS